MRTACTLLAIFLSVGALKAQDCTGNRYAAPMFTSVTEVLNVKYGENKKQDGITNEELFLDIYYPANDTDNQRAVVLLAHGGSFIAGSRQDIADLCRNYAKLGYVTVSMSYRLITPDMQMILNPSLEFQKGVVRAVHDMKAAIRFIRGSATTGNNPYGINPNIIIVGGYSAGAIIANHAVYLDQESEIPTDLLPYYNTQGGLEGTSGTPSVNSNAQMVVSMCGAIKDTTWITTGSVPYVGVHNETDNVVPNIYGTPNVGVPIPVFLYGDSLMYTRALNQNIPAKYKMVRSSGHCDFPAAETFTFVTNAVYEQLCVQNLFVQKMEEIPFSIYPNPSQNELTIAVSSTNSSYLVEIFDLMGKQILRGDFAADQQTINLNISNLSTGVYTVRLMNQEGQSSIKKLIKE